MTFVLGPSVLIVEPIGRVFCRLEVFGFRSPAQRFVSLSASLERKDKYISRIDRPM